MRGIVPDGMVQTRLSSFIDWVPNLGVDKNSNSKTLKTATCQLLDSGGKRKRKFEDKDNKDRMGDLHKH